MRLRWTQPASRDFTQICDYIAQHGSSAAAGLRCQFMNSSRLSENFRLWDARAAEQVLASWFCHVCPTLPSIEYERTLSKFFEFFTEHKLGPSEDPNNAASLESNFELLVIFHSHAHRRLELPNGAVAHAPASVCPSTRHCCDSRVLREIRPTLG